MIALKGKVDIGDKINKQVIAPLVDANPRLARSDFPDFNDPNKLGEGQQGKLENVSQTHTGRNRQLAERYATPLPQIVKEVAALADKVDAHLKKMGAKLHWGYRNYEPYTQQCCKAHHFNKRGRIGNLSMAKKKNALITRIENGELKMENAK